MAEDLIPKGQAYGSRQKTVANMRQAGLPTSSENAAPPPPGAGTAAAPSRFSPGRGGAAPNEDPLRAIPATSPLAQVPTPEDVLMNVASRARNPMVQVIVQRLLEGD